MPREDFHERLSSAVEWEIDIELFVGFLQLVGILEMSSSQCLIEGLQVVAATQSLVALVFLGGK